MSDAMQGVIIGGVIALSGSLIVVIIQIIFQKVSENRRYRADWLKEKKREYYLMIERFLKMEFYILDVSKGVIKSNKSDFVNKLSDKIAMIDNVRILMPRQVRDYVQEFYNLFFKFKNKKIKAAEFRKEVSEFRKEVTDLRKKISDFILDDVENLENAIYKLP